MSVEENLLCVREIVVRMGIFDQRGLQNGSEKGSVQSATTMS
jgi:hypothetical protein